MTTFDFRALAETAAASAPRPAPFVPGRAALHLLRVAQPHGTAYVPDCWRADAVQLVQFGLAAWRYETSRGQIEITPLGDAAVWRADHGVRS